MKSIADREVLARRALFSHVASLGGIFILLAGVAVVLWLPQYYEYSPYLIFGGFAISSIGIYFANRWVKKPRPENVLDAALRKLNNSHTIYHYLLPEEHVLVTPTGVVVLQTCALDGEFTYRHGKWRQKFSMSRAMRFFVEETLGNPIAEAQAGAKAIQALLGRHVSAPVPVDCIVVFTSPRAEYEVEKPEVPVVLPEKLRARLPQHPKLPPGVLAEVRHVINAAARIADDKEEDEEESSEK